MFKMIKFYIKNKKGKVVEKFEAGNLSIAYVYFNKIINAGKGAEYELLSEYDMMP